MQDLKRKVIHGGLAKGVSQVALMVLRMGYLMAMARMLGPHEFGLVGMVAAFTGVLNLFRDFGLSAATVQRQEVTEEQISTLFWINVFVGLALGLLLMALAHFITLFYHEPRLFWVTIALSTSFMFNGAGVQHTAILERQMRFTALATIDVLALIFSIALAIGMALTGFGYWALVASTVSIPLVTTLCLWHTTGWIPGRPRSGVGLYPLMRFGGALTIISVTVYIAYNLEKVLLGRFWGADAVGIYGRAYQLSNIPTDTLNSSFWGLAFSGLSRVRHDPVRLKTYFLKGYSLLLGLTIPIAISAALFAPDLVLVLLGSKWRESAPLLRLLTPTILVFALINPLSWLTFSLGMIGRNLKIVLVIAPVVICGYVLGLPYGPRGVAFGYSAAMVLLALPITAWSVHGTVVSFRDILSAVRRPLFSGIGAAAIALWLQVFLGQSLPAFARVMIGVVVLFACYLWMLLFVMGQKPVYMDLIRGLRKSPSVDADVMASV